MRTSLFILATTLSLAVMKPAAAQTVTVDGGAGGTTNLALLGTTVINFDGGNGSTTYDGLSASLALTFAGYDPTAYTYTFTYLLTNTSTTPIDGSRVTAFGFDVNPDNPLVTATGTFDSIASGGITDGKSVEICLYAGMNCQGGANDGLTIGAGGEGSFTLDYDAAVALTLSNFVDRYQSIDGTAVTGGSGTGTPVGGAVPEPGTWAMMLLGFGAMGIGLRRKKASAVRLHQAA